MVKKTIILAANTDYRFDQRLQRISLSLMQAGYSVDLLGRQFENEAIVFSSARHVRLWFSKGKAAYAELNIRFFFHLFFRKSDAICSVDLDTLPACWLAARLKGSYLIQDSHEYMAEVPEVSSRPFTKKIWHLVAKQLLPACHLRYTVSRSLVDEFYKVYGQSFELIRNMAHLHEADPVSVWVKPEAFPKEDYYVFLGAVNKGRGLEEFLSVLSERDETLVIIGEGDLSHQIRELVRNLELEDRVFFAGKVRPEFVRGILEGARAGINLLREESLSYRYSLANKFFDYLHAGIPQICINFPEYSNLMSEFRVGVLCELDNASIHSAMDQMKDENLKSLYRSEALKARKQWNWQQESKRLLRLYDALFKGEPFDAKAIAD
jgi:glycosyltransferase involved in cell wall biosynthesis